MNRRTIGVDLAKDVFEIAVTCGQGRIRERHRFNRTQFTEFMARAEPAEVVMEACGTAHFWGGGLILNGITVLTALRNASLQQWRYADSSI